MTRIATAVIALAFMHVVAAPAFAEENVEYRSDLCVEDSAACRGFALEIAKMDVTETINKARGLVPTGSFLCPEDNPQCCPPRLQPMCVTYRDALVDWARAQLQLSARSERCPFEASICESLGSLYCGPNEVFIPWRGCSGIVVVDPPRPPWPPCPPGKKHNSKGFCIDEPCFFRDTGLRIPCNFAPDNNEFFANRTFQATSTAPAPNLIKHLNDKDLRLQAARQVLEDLKAAANSVEEQIKQLTR